MLDRKRNGVMNEFRHPAMVRLGEISKQHAQGVRAKAKVHQGIRKSGEQDLAGCILRTAYDGLGAGE